MKLALLPICLVAACYTSTRDPAVPSAQSACPQPLAGTEATWRHRFGSAIVASLSGAPHHATVDPVINPGQDALITAKFAYGPASKDLQDERVSLWLQAEECGRWDEIATALTDGDGRLGITVPAAHIREPGAHPFQLVVGGDLSKAWGTIYVVEPGTRAVVFDIDGTITTDDAEIAEQVLLDREAEARPGAARVVRRYADAGYLPVYVTGRPYMLRSNARGWLDRFGFPPGPLITTDSLRASLPGDRGVGAYKQGVLSALTDDRGIDVAYAYGNAATDVCAYARVGIDPQDTYIVGGVTAACDGHPRPRTFRDYRQHLNELPIRER